MIFKRFAADRQPKLQNLDGFAQRQRIAFERGGFVRPERGELLNQRLADIGWKSFVKQGRRLRRPFPCFQKGKHCVIGDIQAVFAVQHFRNFTERNALLPEIANLRLKPRQTGRRTLHNGDKLLSRPCFVTIKK